MKARYLFDIPGQQAPSPQTAPPPTSVAPPQSGGGAAQGGQPNWGFVRDAGGYGKDFAAMLKAGYTGLLFLGDDPNIGRGMAEARNAGLQVGIWQPPHGRNPEQLAANLAQLNEKYHPQMIVADIESEGKGYQGSEGWNYNERFAAAYQKLIPNTPWAVTMMPMQDDFNYKAYSSRGAQIWPQAYGGGSSGTESKFDPEATVQRVVKNGVDPSLVRPVLAPGQNHPKGVMYTLDDIYAKGAGYPKVGEPVMPEVPTVPQSVPPIVRRPEQTDQDPYPAAGVSADAATQEYSDTAASQARQYAAAQAASAITSYSSPSPSFQPTGQAIANTIAARAQDVLDEYLRQNEYLGGSNRPIPEPDWSASRVADVAKSRIGGYYG